MRNKQGSAVVVGVVFVLVVVIASVVLGWTYVQERTEVVTVQKKFIDVSREGSHYVLVTDKGLFEVDRPWWKVFEPKYNPDKVWASISEGKDYKIYYVGWYVDIFYWYPLVFYAEPVS